jgi:hypothetical protein
MLGYSVILITNLIYQTILINKNYMKKLFLLSFLTISSFLFAQSTQTVQAATIYTLNPGVAGSLCSGNYPGRTCKASTQADINIPTPGHYTISVRVERGNNTNLYECQGKEDFYMIINGQKTSVIKDPDACEFTGTVKTQSVPGEYTLKTGINVIQLFHAHISETGIGIESLTVQAINFQLIPAPINGTCGNRTATYPATTTNWLTNSSFCSTGTVSPANPIFPAQGATTDWTCVGSNGGSTATCHATREVAPPEAINGACGTRSTTYSDTTTDWLANTNFCSTGTVSPANPIFPAQGATTDWTCVGSNGGSTATCHATRGSVVPTPTPTPTPTPEPEEENHECKGEIGNYIWLDSNGDGQQDESEQGLAGIRVKLTNLTNDDTSTLYTTKNGKYEFHDLCEGKYVVNVKEKDVEQYTQTYDPDGTKNNKTDVKLDSDRDSHMKADFGYKGKRVAPATGSGNLAIYLSALITLIAMSTYIRVRARKLAQQK